MKLETSVRTRIVIRILVIMLAFVSWYSFALVMAQARPLEQEASQESEASVAPVIAESESDATSRINKLVKLVPASSLTLYDETQAPIYEIGTRVGSAEESNYLDVPMDDESNTGFKSWMDYRVLTAKSSIQYKLQQEAWTDEQGFRRYGDYYMVALGTYYSPTAGELFRITLEDGTSFEAVNGDVKDDSDTDELHQHKEGNIVEFIVDTDAISWECSVMGDMSWAGFHGKIKSIEHIGSAVADVQD